MKKSTFFCTFFLSFLFLSEQAFSQCSIVGPFSVIRYETEQFHSEFIPGATYSWSVTGGLGIVGTNTSTTVNVHGYAPSNNSKVCVTRYEAGLETCNICKTVPVLLQCNPAEGVNILNWVDNICSGENFEFEARLGPAETTIIEDNFYWETGLAAQNGQPEGPAVVTQTGGAFFFPTVYTPGYYWYSVEYVSCDGSAVELNAGYGYVKPLATSVTVTQLEDPVINCPGFPILFNATLNPPILPVEVTNFYWEGGSGIVGQNPLQTQLGGTEFLYWTSEDGPNWVTVTYTNCDESVAEGWLLVTFDENCILGGGDENMLLGQGGGNGIAPNPFMESTTLSIEMEETKVATIEIFNLKGELLFSRNEQLYKGSNQVELDDFPEDAKGLLVYKLKVSGDLIDTGKMLRIE